MDENDEWLDSKSLAMPIPGKRAPIIDEIVSKIVGRPVTTTDPRLIKFVIGWKKQTGSNSDSMNPDNMLENPQFMRGLKQAFSEG